MPLLRSTRRTDDACTASCRGDTCRTAWPKPTPDPKRRQRALNLPQIRLPIQRPNVQIEGQAASGLSRSNAGLAVSLDALEECKAG